VAMHHAKEIKIQALAILRFKNIQMKRTLPPAWRKGSFEFQVLLRIGGAVARQAARNAHAFDPVDIIVGAMRARKYTSGQSADGHGNEGKGRSYHQGLW
jgi:hypothetical protein